MASSPVDIKELRKLLSSITLLYVEDNAALQEKAVILFKKLFDTVHIASDGKEGLELFKQHAPHIVITDIQMPHMNGLEMAKAIRTINKEIKIIVTSAYDDKEYLLEAITIGLSGYLIKPLNVSDVTSLLQEVATQVIEERNKTMFNSYLYSIFNNQNNLIIMLKNETAALANEHALKFFNAANLKELKDKIRLLDTLLLRHDSFLYAKTDGLTCLARVKKEIDKLYNIKILDAQHSPHHFILRLTAISDKEDFFILSLTDITELNLLSLYDKNALDYDLVLKDEKTVTALLQAAKEAAAVVKIYNFYKGLVVSNNAIITYSNPDLTVFKTSLVQQKAIQYEKKVIFSSELFPCDIQSAAVEQVNFHNQSVELGKCVMLKTTPVNRKYLVLEPHPKHKVNFFYGNHRFDTDIALINISVESVRLSMTYLPAGLKAEDAVVLDMVFSDQLKPIIINTKAKIYKIISNESSYHIVATLILTPMTHKLLIEYMSTRQMQLVREFKGLSHAK